MQIGGSGGWGGCQGNGLYPSQVLRSPHPFCLWLPPSLASWGLYSVGGWRKEWDYKGKVSLHLFSWNGRPRFPSGSFAQVSDVNFKAAGAHGLAEQPQRRESTDPDGRLFHETWTPNWHPWEIGLGNPKLKESLRPDVTMVVLPVVFVKIVCANNHIVYKNGIWSYLCKHCLREGQVQTVWENWDIFLLWWHWPWAAESTTATPDCPCHLLATKVWTKRLSLTFFIYQVNIIICLFHDVKVKFKLGSDEETLHNQSFKYQIKAATVMVIIV